MSRPPPIGPFESNSLTLQQVYLRTGSNALEDEPGGLTDDLAEARVAPAVSLIVQAGHVPAECVGEDRGWSEHDTPLPS